MEDHLTLVLVLVPTLGIAAQWIAWRVKIPAIVLLLGAGVLAGPVTGVLHPARDFGPLLPPLIRLSVALILFEGGLSLKFAEWKAAGAGVRRLVFPGVPVAWALGTLASRFVGGLSWPVSLTFGAILVVTGPTVILPLLRHARLKKRPASYLKWEGILNDPIGALLAVLVFESVAPAGPGGRFGSVLLGVALTVAAAGVLGIGGGLFLARAFRRGWVPEFLKAPILVGSAMAVSEIANLAQHEAGLAAATVLGIVLGNSRLPAMDEIRRFKEYVAVLLVSGVFVMLTADLDPGLVAGLTTRSGLLLVVLLFVVRPAAVWLSTIGAGLDVRERLLVAWIAPRGIVAAAVAAAFAPGLAAAGHADADLLLPLTFAFIFLTVTAHGLTIGPIARRLGLSSPSANGVLIAGSSPFSVAVAQALRDLEVPVLVADASWHRLRDARMAGIPVHYGEIVSERSEEDLEFSGMGTLLALTSNDAYNSLVCTRFAAEFGRDRVFQLPFFAKDEDDPRAIPPALRGNVAFGEEATWEALVARHYRGDGIRKTRLTETFSDEEHRLGSAEGSLRLLAVGASGEVRVHSAKNPLEPRPGDTVLTFGPAEREPAAPGG